MGIAGLLKHLRSITKRVHIREYNGLKAAVDLHCWIHKGSIGCCRELSEGIATTAFVDYCMQMLKLLVAHGITPIVVFDGKSLPAKHITNTTRRNSRHENTEKAREAEADGRFADAHSYFQKTTTVTANMVHQVILALKQHNIQFIVAPYEADAQLAFLSLSGAVDVVITEDSDAIVYGCRRVLFKLNKDGSGDEIRRRSLGANQGLTFLNWTDDQFKLMCCLAGCDYVKKIKNIGIVTAHKFVNKYKTFTKTTDALMLSKYDGIDMAYVKQLRRAMNTFKHQTIFNPELSCLEPLTPIRNQLTLNYDARFERRQSEDADCEYLGPILARDVATGVVTGLLHPYTLLPFEEKGADVEKKMKLTEEEQNQLVEGQNRRSPCSLQQDKGIKKKFFDPPPTSAVWSLVEQEVEQRREVVSAEFLSEGRNKSKSRITDGNTYAHNFKSRESNTVDDDDLWRFSFKGLGTTAPSIASPPFFPPHGSTLSPRAAATPATSSYATSHQKTKAKGQPKDPSSRKKKRKAANSDSNIDFVPLPIDMLHRKSRGRMEGMVEHGSIGGKTSFFVHAPACLRNVPSSHGNSDINADDDHLDTTAEHFDDVPLPSQSSQNPSISLTTPIGHDRGACANGGHGLVGTKLVEDNWRGREDTDGQEVHYLESDGGSDFGDDDNVDGGGVLGLNCEPEHGIIRFRPAFASSQGQGVGTASPLGQGLRLWEGLKQHGEAQQYQQVHQRRQRSPQEGDAACVLPSRLLGPPRHSLSHSPRGGEGRGCEAYWDAVLGGL